MEKLYEIKITSYNTLLYKDYCEVDETDLLGEHISDSPQVFGFFSLPNKIRKEFDYDKTFTDEESYVKNFNNPCANTTFKRIILSVGKSEEKISLKFFQYEKYRQAGKTYYKKETTCHFLTYNFIRNCLYRGTIRNYHKKKKVSKSITKNVWFTKPIQSFVSLFVNYVRGMRLNDFETIEQSGRDINDGIKTFLSNISGVDMTIDGYDNIIYKRYLDGIGVKVPNNWINYNRTYPQITKKVFKKHKYKFVDAFMDLNKLSGDKIKRVLHNVNTTNGIETFKFALYFFGNDLILSQPDDLIKEIIECSVFFMDWEMYLNHHRHSLKDYTKNEVKNCFEIFKLVIRGDVNLHSFTDHIAYKARINNFEPVLWKSKNYDKFIEEHYIWSEKISEFKNSQYNRFYYEPFKKYIETPINEFYPVLLSEHKEYVKESFEQSNCVRTYADRPDSIIISVRKGDVNGRERATIEYKIRKYDENITLKRVQSLGRFNNKLDSTWDNVLTTLDDRINNSLDTNLFELPKVEIKNGGKSFISNIIFLGTSEFLQEKKLSQIAVFDKSISNHKSDNIFNLFI
jgi:hypothetical protein